MALVPCLGGHILTISMMDQVMMMIEMTKILLIMIIFPRE